MPCPTRAERSAVTGACEQTLVSFIPFAIRVIPRFARNLRQGRRAAHPRAWLSRGVARPKCRGKVRGESGKGRPQKIERDRREERRRRGRREKKAEDRRDGGANIHPSINQPADQRKNLDEDQRRECGRALVDKVNSSKGGRNSCYVCSRAKAFGAINFDHREP